jgi:hypothetical protein
MGLWDDILQYGSDAVDEGEKSVSQNVGNYFDQIVSDPMVIVRDITSNPTVKQLMEGTPATSPPIAKPATKNPGILNNAVGVSMLQSRIAGVPMILILAGVGAIAFFSMKRRG